LELVAFNQQTAAATCPRSKRFGMTANGLAASERLASFVAAWNAAGFRTHLFVSPTEVELQLSRNFVNCALKCDAKRLLGSSRLRGGN
jgi:predicted deacetylase